MSGVSPGPPGRPGLQEPVTRDDLRSLRRWVIVAGVWAVAATAIALIALLDTSGDDAGEKAEADAAKVAKDQRALDARIDKLESQLEGLPQSEDVSKLEGRLATVERDAKKAAADSKSAGEKVTDLEDRVKTLEDAADSDTGDGTDTGANPPP